jgi:membrane fusion protein (multidrug efflux system)
MPVSFANTLRSLERESAWWLGLVPALLFLLAWSLWLSLASVGVYASARSARVEVYRMASRVVAEQGGRIVALRSELGSRVRQGEILLELESSVEKAVLAQRTVELDTCRSRLAAVQKQIAAAEARRASRARMDGIATRSADFELERARVTSAYKEELSSIAQDLYGRHLTSRIDALTADAERAGSRIATDGAAIELARLQAARVYADKSALLELAELGRALADLTAEQQVKDAEIRAAQAALERRTVRAPASGRLGSIAPLRAGDVVQTGEVIATVVPEDDVHMVAEFAPEAAVGRIVPGQRARIQLSGFAWTDYGMLEATVVHVANEPRNGTIRTELLLHRQSAPRVPIQHGLPGSVDVRVEESTPFALLLRSVGVALTGTPPARTDHLTVAQGVSP